VHISTQRAQPIHLCSSTSGIIAIGTFNSLNLAYVRNYLNPMPITKQRYNNNLPRYFLTKYLRD
jgi:hypothetical protein